MQKVWLVHGRQDARLDFRQNYALVNGRLVLPNWIILTADSITLLATHSHASFPLLFLLLRNAKGMSSTCLTGFWLVFSPEVRLGQWPTCFTELSHFGSEFHDSTFKPIY
jgi:hypothetical protein